MGCRWLRILLMVAIATSVTVSSTSAAMEVLQAFYRPDRVFPEYGVFWTYTAYRPGSTFTPIREGGAICVYIRNSGASSITISDVLINGESLEGALQGNGATARCRCGTVSVYYNRNQTLIDAGVPVWWHALPKTIAPGEVSQVYVYLRYRRSSPLSIQVVAAGGNATASVAISGTQVPRIAGANLSPDSNRLYLYLRHPQKGKLPTTIKIDNVDVTSNCIIGADPDIDLVTVKVNLSATWARGSFHSFQAIYDDGTSAMDGMRMFADDFMYGVWGEPKSGLNAAYCADVARHSINRLEEGAGETAGYFSNHVDLMTQWGIWQDNSQTTFWPRTYSLFLCDEPDAGDCTANTQTAPTEADRPGTMAQDLSKLSQSWNASYPAYPTYLNVDENFKPYTWYVYSRVADQFSVDPYYHNALSDVYYSRPWKLPIYTKATYQLAVSDTAVAASEPVPLQVIIATGRFQEETSAFRWLTPEEDRICAYYSIAAGAKHLCYWWMTGTNRTLWGYNGIGIPDQPGSAALWREMGLVGAELGTLSPLIQSGCAARMPITASTGRLWTRALLCGVDTMLLICINDDHANDRSGSIVRSIDDCNVSFDLPAWLLSPANVFEVDYKGIHDVSYSVAGGHITLDLGRTDVTRAIVITSDNRLKGQLQSRYTSIYGPRVSELIP